MTSNASRTGAAESLLDPQMRVFLEEVAAFAADYPDPLSLPIADARGVIERVLRPFAHGGPIVESSDRTVALDNGDMRLRRYVGARAGGPLLVYLHGGGWTWESIATHDHMARRYAALTGFGVLTPDYPLAPERPFPVAADQIVELLRTLGREAVPWDAAAGVMLIGDSAGANLALSACMSLRDDPAMPKALLLNYGAYARRFDRPSYDWIEASALGPKRAQIAWFWNNYLGGREDADWRAEPLRGSFERLPPMRLQVAQLDVLHDENLALAAAASKAEVDVECDVISGVTHGFLRAIGRVEAADRAFAAGCRWLVAKSVRQADAMTLAEHTSAS